MDATGSSHPQSRSSGVGPWLLLALAAAVVFFLVTFVLRTEIPPKGTGGPIIGKSLPYLELEPLTGDARAVSLADLTGRVTLLNYWGTWCPPCRREFPHIVELSKKFAAEPDFRLYAVSSGSGADEDIESLRGETADFLKAYGAQLPTYVDPRADSRRSMVVSFGMDGFDYPTTLVLDRQGKIRGLWVGFESTAPGEMRVLVEALLKEPAEPVRDPA